MKKMKKGIEIIKKSMILGFFLITIISSNAQRLSLSGSLGISGYRGDLTNPGHNPPVKPAFSLGATYDITSRYRIRVNLSTLSINGDDLHSNNSGKKPRNLNFKSKIQEAAILGEFDLVDNSFNSIIPYLLGGFSVYHFDPHPLRPIDSLGDVDLHSIGTEGQYLPGGKYSDRKYSLTQLNIQIGGGIRVELSEKVSIAIEANYRKLFTDYLDDVSANSYISKQEWEKGIAQAGGNKTALGHRLQLAEDYSWRYIDSKGNAISIPSTPTSNGILYPRGDPSQNDAFYSFQVRFNIRLNALRTGADLYTPRNPNGRGQLRCARRVF
jgi:Domain of unknown function (DUF6089)